MTEEEFKKIKKEYQRIKDLLQEQKDLNEVLETRKDLYKNLCKLAQRLEIVDDELFGIDGESDIYRHLAQCNTFEDFKCSAPKKIYFFYGYVCEDKVNGENWNGKRIVFVPRNTNFNLLKKYYAMYWDLVNTRDYELIPIKDIASFKSKNHIIDIGKDIDCPYSNTIEYNRIRQDFNHADSIETSYEKYRLELFKYFVQAETEQEAIDKLVLKHQKNHICSN